MERPRNRQSGFSTVGILVACLVVVALIGVGVFVYQHNRTALTNAAGGTQTSQQTTNTTTQQTATTGSYLTITEWGVKLPLSSSISDAYYVVNPSSWKDPDGLPSQVWLGRKSFTNASCNPANNNEGQRGAIGSILRVPPTEQDQVTGQLLTQKYPNGVTVNGYYYAYQSWATSNPCASQANLQPFDSAFAAAAKGIIQATAN